MNIATGSLRTSSGTLAGSDRGEDSKLMQAAYNERFRPQFHFSPSRNWMNDPHGLIYHDGEYHLFYQHNAEAARWGPMSWGHAVSADLITWHHLPIAISPDAIGGIWNRAVSFTTARILVVFYQMVDWLPFIHMKIRALVFPIAPIGAGIGRATKEIPSSLLLAVIFAIHRYFGLGRPSVGIWRSLANNRSSFFESPDLCRWSPTGEFRGAGR